MIKNGDVVYFKRARAVLHGGKKKEMEFDGHGYGIFLGHVPDFMPPPPKEIVLSAMGAIGFVSWDDLTELVGKETVEKIIPQWQEKYTKAIDKLAKEAVDSGRLKILGPDGKPIQVKKELVVPKEKKLWPGQCPHCMKIDEGGHVCVDKDVDHPN